VQALKVLDILTLAGQDTTELMKQGEHLFPNEFAGSNNEEDTNE
jgi:hypothetical protein